MINATRARPAHWHTSCHKAKRREGGREGKGKGIGTRLLLILMLSPFLGPAAAAVEFICIFCCFANNSYQIPIHQPATSSEGWEHGDEWSLNGRAAYVPFHSSWKRLMLTRLLQAPANGIGQGRLGTWGNSEMIAPIKAVIVCEINLIPPSSSLCLCLLPGSGSL